MDEFNDYHRHYVRLRADGCIVEGWSDGPFPGREATEADVCITDRGGYQFRLQPEGEENPALYDYDFMVPLYRWTGQAVEERSGAEIAAETAEARSEAERAERERIANATETVLLEMAADHEERICVIEMGVDFNDL